MCGLKSEELRNINIEVSNGKIELSIEDFEYIIDAALANADEFFIMLWDKLDEIKELNDKIVAVS